MTKPLIDPAVYEQWLLESSCAAFLHREADLLDRRRFDDWLALLHPGLRYDIPVRVTVDSDRRDVEFSAESVHTSDSYRSIEMRVRRLQTEHAYAENPPSRTNRLVTNVVARADDEGLYSVRSKLLLYRSQGGSTGFDIVTGDRDDVLATVDGDLKLLRRTVHLAHTTLPTANLGVFL